MHDFGMESDDYTDSLDDVVPTNNRIGLLAILPYLVVGPPVIVFNLFLLWFLVRSNEARGQRPYQVLAGCAVFDVVFSSAYLATGIYRLQLLNSYDRLFY